MGQAGLHAAVASDGVEVGLLAFFGMGECDDEAASVGRPGGATGGDDAGGEALDLAAVGGHDAEFAAERSADLALGGAVGGEGDPAAIGREDGVGVVVGAAGELGGFAVGGVDAEEVMPGVDAVAERVAAVVDVAHDGGAGLAVVGYEAGGVDVDDGDQGGAVGRPDAAFDGVGEVGESARLAAGEREKPDLAGGIGVGGVGGAEEGELRAVGRPDGGAVARTGGQLAIAVGVVEGDGADVRLGGHGFARGAGGDVGDGRAVGGDCGSGDGGQVEDQLGRDRLARLAGFGRARSGASGGHGRLQSGICYAPARARGYRALFCPILRARGG